MPKTISVTTYKYEELSPEAQEKARQWYREASSQDDWMYEDVYEDAETIAKLMGIEIAHRNVPTHGGKSISQPTIYWSGFSSQGDGACFEGSWSASAVQPGKVKDHAPVDKELHRIAGVFEEIAKEYPDASFTVKHSGHYQHKYCTEFDVSFGDTVEEQFEKDLGVNQSAIDRVEQAEKDLIEAARDFMQWIYRQLESAWDHSQQDETVAESIIANEYDFTAEGKRSVVLNV